jgi:predicted RNase H-like HicB family nuclease
MRGDTILGAGGEMVIKVVVTQGEDGYVVANCPSLKSCWSQGKTREEALKNIREAIALFLEPQPNELTQDEAKEVVELSL